MKTRSRLAVFIAVCAAAAGASNAFSSTLTLIPIPSWLSGTNINEARAVTRDGKFVVGFSGTSADAGFLYDVDANTVVQPNADGTVPNMLTGVAYRTDPVSGEKQLILDGYSASVQANWMTTNAGVSWGAARRDPAFAPNTFNAANTLGATEGSDIFFQIVRNSTQRELYTNMGSNTWDSVTPPSFINNVFLNLPTGITGNMNGVTPNGRAVGQRRVDNIRNNFIIDYPPSTGTAFYFAGLTGGNEGEAFSVSADGLVAFGRSPLVVGGTDLYGYKVVNPGPSQTLQPLPEFPDTAGSTSRCTPYSCSVDGDYACGMNFRGIERACVWKTAGADTNAWTITDLTDLATSEGILGTFTRLSRAYSMGTNSSGDPVIVGVGVAGGFTRGFVMVVTPAAPSGTLTPSISAVTGAGTAAVTVHYTNTISGTNYVLEYRTNFNTTNWTTVGTQAASGTTDSQTDNSANGQERYYRVYYAK